MGLRRLLNVESYENLSELLNGKSVDLYLATTFEDVTSNRSNLFDLSIYVLEGDFTLVPKSHPISITRTVYSDYILINDMGDKKIVRLFGNNPEKVKIPGRKPISISDFILDNIKHEFIGVSDVSVTRYNNKTPNSPDFIWFSSENIFPWEIEGNA